MYTKSTLKPWSGRSRKTPHKPWQVTNPGQIVLVHLLVSPTPSLVASITGIITTKIYNYATIFMDHFHRYSYMHLQQTVSDEDTLEEYGTMIQTVPSIMCSSSSPYLGWKKNAFVQEPAMVSDVEDTQLTVISKEKTIVRTWTGHTLSVQPSEISDD